MKVNALERIFRETGYDNFDPENAKYLIEGFKTGFSLNYCGLRKIMRTANNIKISVGSETEMWNKVMKEVSLKRFAGPYPQNSPPFKYFIQSPIGLVAKDGGKDTWLIFHLSYPKSGGSINACIPKKRCTVTYPDFMDAVNLCQEAGKFAFCSKSDMKSAFRNLPLKVRDFHLLLMRAKNQKNQKWYWFVEKCLSFGSSISCKIFQDFSDSIAYVVRKITGKENVNYLDDYLFVALLRACCNNQINVFIDICSTINFPISMEKTVWASQIVVFLGLLIDNINQVICIPKEKVERAQQMVEKMLGCKKRKATVLSIQKLTDYLNFLCKCIVP